MRGKLKIFALLLLVVAGFFGYQGVQGTGNGKENVFTVEDKVTIEVTKDEQKIYYSFLNTSGENISSITVNFGIKGDSNYDTKTDEVSIHIENFGLLADPFVIDFYKDDFKTGQIVRDGKLAGKATITVGTNIVQLEEYDYVHSISINGQKENFTNGSEMDVTKLLIAGASLLVAIIMLVYSRKPNSDSTELVVESNADEELQNEWNSHSEGHHDESESTYTPTSSSKLTDEEKNKYIEGMEVIDMDKDEL